jgi:hypothetical protein
MQIQINVVQEVVVHKFAIQEGFVIVVLNIVMELKQDITR